MNTELTGKASIDRPWLKFYQGVVEHLNVPECTLREYLTKSCDDVNIPAVHYYGTDISWAEMLVKADRAARALKAIGFNEGDQIPVFFRSVPEFIALLLAAETIGASLLCRDNTLEENVEAVVKSGAKVIFAHDFLTQKEADAYVKDAGVEHIVLLSPYHETVEAEMPEHVKSHIRSFYGTSAQGLAVMSWDEFIKAGEGYTGSVEAPQDIHRPLFRAYTSGSTGPSKQVIHSANSMIGIVYQMTFYGAHESIRPKWLLTLLPPALVAVVVSMILVPLASNKLLILDPFCDVFDIDLEFMRYRPNCWPHIPMFIEILMKSPRMPKDYDMSHLLVAGAGCEAFNNGQIRRIQQFLNDHNCKAAYASAYGQSEAGSNCTLPCPVYPAGDGNIGIPMPLTTLAVFKPGTEEELSYNELGELCKTGPGNMLGYDDEESTKKALKLHSDGQVWLHTGDLGYINEEGIVFVLTRGNSKRFGGGRLIDLVMENRVIDANIDGIVDAFFLSAPDDNHEGYFLPYLYVVLKDGYTVEDIHDAVYDALELHEHPVKITQLPERPFFHFKTNRVGLRQELKSAAN